MATEAVKGSILSPPPHFTAAVLRGRWLGMAWVGFAKQKLKHGGSFLVKNALLYKSVIFPLLSYSLPFLSVQSNIALLSCSLTKTFSLFLFLVSAQVKINSFTWFTQIIFLNER